MSGVKGKTGIYIRTEKQKEQILKAGLNTRFIKGRKLSEETKDKISKTLMGKKKLKVYFGDKAPNWKGNKVGYRGLHSWIHKSLGNVKKCWKCGTEIALRYEWSNISGEYKRDLSDWERLCVKCHRLKDDWVNKVAIKSEIYQRRFL